jgi:uncharacterized membrane protein YkvA (DUF1232 family)
MFNQSNQNVVLSSGGFIQEIGLRAKLFFRLLADGRVSIWAKLVPLAGLIYWLSPIDMISIIPGLAAVDDVAILWFVQYMFIELCPPAIVNEISAQLAGGLAGMQSHPEEDVVDGEAVDVTGR